MIQDHGQQNENLSWCVPSPILQRVLLVLKGVCCCFCHLYCSDVCKTNKQKKPTRCLCFIRIIFPCLMHVLLHFSMCSLIPDLYDECRSCTGIANYRWQLQGYYNEAALANDPFGLRCVQLNNVNECCLLIKFELGCLQVNFIGKIQ